MPIPSDKNGSNVLIGDNSEASMLCGIALHMCALEILQLLCNFILGKILWGSQIADSVVLITFPTRF